MTTDPEPHPSGRAPRVRSLSPASRRATVIGAGSFGTALALLLSRGGLRTTLQTRTIEQASLIDQQRENRQYLPGVELPAQLRIEPASAGVARADYVFLAVPSRGLGEVIENLTASGLGKRTAIVSAAKGLVPPHGTPPTILLAERFGADRVACLGGPAHAQEMVHAGAGLVAACAEEELARAIAQVFTRAGVVCELSNDPIGVELAGAAKNAAALAAGATEAQGLNAAGAAAGHIFAEVWRYAEGLGARPESMIGLAGAGDLLATALARESQPPRRRAAGRRGVRRGDPRAHRPGGRGARVRAAARARVGGSQRCRPRHQRARPPDLRRAAAGRVGGAGTRDRAAARALAQAPKTGVLAARMAAARRRSATVIDRVVSHSLPRRNARLTMARWPLYRRISRDRRSRCSGGVTSSSCSH